MTRRAENLGTLRLSLAILQRLDTRSQTTAADLHRDLSPKHGRDLRTYQRLLKALVEAGLANCEPGQRPLGFRRTPDAVKLTSTLTAEESLFLELARQQLACLLPPQAQAQVGELLHRARLALQPAAPQSIQMPGMGRPGRSTHRERAWLRKVAIAPTSMPLLAPVVRPGVGEVVAQALFEDRWIEIDYRPASGRLQRDRRIMPLGLMQQGSRRYLIGCPEGTMELRQFALHRMEAARDTGLPLPDQGERPAFDFQAYIDSGQAGFGSGQQLRVVIDIEPESGDHLRETPLSMDQRIEPGPDGWIRVTATVPDSLWFWDWLRGFGHRAELVEPGGRVESYWDWALPTG